MNEHIYWKYQGFLFIPSNHERAVSKSMLWGFHEVSPNTSQPSTEVQTGRVYAWDDSEDHWNSAWDISSTINRYK